jgi:ferric iron reductase protein FhuF
VPGRLARGFVDGVLLPVVAPIVSAVERHHPVSSKILWGNVASGVAGAAKMIGLAEPALAAQAWSVVGALCAGEGPLRGAGGLIAPAQFRRRSCCLIYRLDPRAHGDRANRAAYRNALCEDCVLHRP